jgi:hypothetical protein
MIRSWRLIISAIAAMWVIILPRYAFPQASEAEYIAGSFGMAHYDASVCGRPTAPIETMLDRYLIKIGAGPMEAARLRGKMISTQEIMRGVGHRVDCARVDQLIAEILQNIRAHGG